MAPASRSRNSHTRKELQREIQRRQAYSRDKDKQEDPDTTSDGGRECEEREAWSPTSQTALKALVSARLCSAIWSLISDCDETFNYWEPTHYMVYGKGLQTWEYSPVFALRSYAYILLHAVPGKIYASLLQSNRMLVFFFIRCLLALGCSGCELFFYRGVCKAFGPVIGSLTIGIMIFSAGMFISATALLPSSFAMYMTFLSIGAWYQNMPQLAIFTTAISTFLGWPFAAVIGVPIAYDIVVEKKKYTMFIKWCLISVVTILVPMIQIDSHYYGRMVIAPLNIVLYNVFSGGHNLYGTEPWHYYFANGFLNFNFAFLSALTLPLLLVLWYLLENHPTTKLAVPSIFLFVSPLYIWLAIFVLQPHKEERFLFPVYPFIALCGALGFDYAHKVGLRVCEYVGLCTKTRRTQTHTHMLALVFLALTSTLSLSRIVGQYRAYHAPLEAYMELNRLAGEGVIGGGGVNVCVGKEWYRYPSSFFIPGLDWNLRFLESEFRGQLPQYYREGDNGTAAVPGDMNDLNREEPSRYVQLKECHLLLDLDDSDTVTERQPDYGTLANWTVVHSTPFLNSRRSNSVLRAFYFPFITEQYSAYNNYTIRRRKSWKGWRAEG